MQRGGQAEEVAQAIVWLLSEKPLTSREVLSIWRAGNKTGSCLTGCNKYCIRYFIDLKLLPLLAITSLYQLKLFLRERDIRQYRRHVYSHR